jgi:hypothetical protein
LPAAHDQLEFFLRIGLQGDRLGRPVIKRKNPLCHTRFIGGKSDLQ